MKLDTSKACHRVVVVKMAFQESWVELVMRILAHKTGQNSFGHEQAHEPNSQF